MGVLNFNLLGSLLNSAVIIAAVAFLVKFFGKIVTDHTPFCDDRKFNTEIFGISFILKNSILKIENLVLIGIFCLFRNFFSNIFFVWVSGASLFLISPYIILRATSYFLKLDYFGKIILEKITISESSNKMLSLGEQIKKEIRNSTEVTIKFFSRKFTEGEISFFSSLTLFLSIIFFFSYAIGISKLIVLLIVFAAYTFIAMATGFVNARFLLVNLYLKNGEILENCKLIKVNDDNLKFMHEGKTNVINKDSFLKFIVIKEIPAEFIKDESIK